MVHRIIFVYFVPFCVGGLKQSNACVELRDVQLYSCIMTLLPRKNSCLIASISKKNKERCPEFEILNDNLSHLVIQLTMSKYLI